MASLEPLATFTRETSHGPIRTELFDTFMISHNAPLPGRDGRSSTDKSYVIPYRSISYFEFTRGESFFVKIHIADMEMMVVGSETDMAMLAQRLARLIA